MHKDRLLDYIHNIFLVKQRVDEEVAQSNGLSPLDVHILTFLEVNADDPTATDIEHRHKIKKNTISVHVDNLVRSGYLVRQSNTVLYGYGQADSPSMLCRMRAYRRSTPRRVDR